MLDTPGGDPAGATREAREVAPPGGAPASWLFTGVTACVFAVLACAGALRHEMWRDELEIWLVARDSGSLVDLLRNLRTEGHPFLWYVLVWCLTRVSRNPVFMQLLNVAIGTATALLVAHRAPFARLQRVLLCLSYFFLYEYTIISRNYGLELGLAFLACALFERRREHWLGLAAVVCLLANSHLYGAIIAMCLTLLILFEVWRERGRDRRAVVASAIALGGVALGVGQVLYQASRMGSTHNDYVPAWSLRWLADGFATVTYGYLPFPDLADPYTWNTNALAAIPDPLRSATGALAGIVLLVLSARALRQRRDLLLAFLLGAGAMLAITLFFWHGWVRHHGQLWLLFVVCLWLGGLAAVPRRSTAWVTAVLGVQLLAAAHAWATDVARPFSLARDTARFVSQPRYRDAILVGSLDFAAQAVAGYLERPIYYPQSGRFDTFVHWGPERQVVPATQVLIDAATLVHEHHRDALVILNYEPQAPPLGQVVQVAPDVAVEGVEQFRGAIVRDEEFFVYRVFDPRGSPRAP